jgi:hypothetical protein
VVPWCWRNSPHGGPISLAGDKSSKHGGGSIIGTTIAMAVNRDSGATQAQLWLASYNSHFGINQQGDIIRSYTKQIAARLREQGDTAEVRK